MPISEKKYDLVNGQIPNMKVVLMYADDTIEEEFIFVDDKYLVLKCGDYYEHLSEKTTCMMKAVEHFFPNAIGVFKSDDDIVPCIPHIESLIRNFAENSTDYAGNQLYSGDHVSYHHRGKTRNPDLYDVGMIMPSCHFTAGPLYYLSMPAVREFNKCDKPLFVFNEDIMVGYYLNSVGISITNVQTYTDDSYKQHIISYQNPDH
jgi:hypothetical protein